MTMLLSPSYFGAASAACAGRDHPPPFLRSCAPIIRPDPTNKERLQVPNATASPDGLTAQSGRASIVRLAHSL